jgi:hypothetical protein
VLLLRAEWLIVVVTATCSTVGSVRIVATDVDPSGARLEMHYRGMDDHAVVSEWNWRAGEALVVGFPDFVDSLQLPRFADSHFAEVHAIRILPGANGADIASHIPPTRHIVDHDHIRQLDVAHAV